MLTSFTRSGVAMLALLATPALALAQSAPPSAPHQGPAAAGAPMSAPHDAAMPTRGMHHHLTRAEREARVEARIKSLHDQLGITAAQQPKWDQFAGVMRDNAHRMEQSFRHRGARLASMSAADNMQSYADLAVAHAQDVQRLAVAFESLYDSFSPAQKQTADALFRHQGPAGRHHGPAAAKKP